MRGLLPPPVLALLAAAFAINYADLPLVVERSEALARTNMPQTSSASIPATQSLISLRVQSVDTSDLVSISQETLFLEERSPWFEELAKDLPSAAPTSVQPTVPAPTTLVPPSIRLLGTVGYEGSRQALIQSTSPSEETWVSLGDRIEAWSVVEIRPNSMLLQLNGEEHLVELGE